MNSIKRKLTSQSGASITYALLLFLVCAVVSSIVLTAGTAASGRISDSVESDQRYYSVTSAAEMLKSMLTGSDHSVVVEEQTITTTVKGEEPSVVTTSKINGSDSAGYSFDLLTEAAAYYTGIKESSDPSAKTVTRDITMKVGNTDSLQVKINETLDISSGRITMVLTNNDGSDKIYSMTVVFDAEIKEKNKTKTKNSRDPETNKKIKTVTKTKTTTMTWYMTSMG